MTSGLSSSRIPAPGVLEIDRSKYPFSSPLFEPEKTNRLWIQELLDKEIRWSERSELSYFEVVDGTGRMDLYEGLDVGDDGVARFVYDAQRSPEIRVFFISVDPLYWKKPSLTRKAFIELLEKTGVPPAFIEVYGACAGALVGSPVYSNIDQEGVIAYELLVQKPHRDYVDVTVYFRYDFPTSCSTCLVFGNEVDQLQNRFWQLFPGEPNTSSARSQRYAQDPFVVLSTIAAEYVTFMNQKLTQLVSTVIKHGQDGPFRVSPAALPTQIKELFFCDMSLVIFMHTLDYYLTWVAFFQRQHRLVNEFRTKIMIDGAQGIENIRRKTESMASQKVSASLDLSASLLGNMSSTVRLLSRQLQLHICVAQNRISQFDSRTNISIAHDSKRVALDVKKDSVAMKTIAALTMVFLPGTFTATFFSMVFFHVTDGPEPRLTVNEHWWLYIAVTVPLTLLVLAVWLGWMRWKRLGMPEDAELEALDSDLDE